MSDPVLIVSGSTPPALTDLYDLMPLVAIEAPGCPENVQKAALRRAGREFCRESGVWRALITTTSTEDEDEYDLNTLVLAAGYRAQVYSVSKVELDDSEVDEDDRTLDQEGVLTFDTAPDESAEAIEVTAMLLPLHDCSSYPTWLLEHWREGIVAAALWRLCAMAKKPWSDKGVAEAKKLEFYQMCGEAKGSVLTGRESGELHATMRRFV